MTTYSTLMNIYDKKIPADIVCMIIDYNTTIISYKEYFSAMIKLAMDHREYLKNTNNYDSTEVERTSYLKNITNIRKREFERKTLYNLH